MNTIAHTAIEYVLNHDGTRGYSWSPLTGCANGPDICACWKECWARHDAKMRGARRGESPEFTPEFHPERLTQPFPRKPSTIFVCPRADLWGDWVPPSAQDSVLDRIRREPQHTFLTLTKRPENYVSGAANLWLGASATDDYGARLALHWLRPVGLHRWLSLEPMLGPMPSLTAQALRDARIGCVVIGALAPGRVTQREWVEAVVAEADKAGVPVFQKKNLAGICCSPLRQEAPWVRHDAP